MANAVFTPGTVRFFVCLCALTHMLMASESFEEQDSKTGPFQYLKIADQAMLEDLKMTETLSVIYYHTTAETPARHNFLLAFDSSAKYLAGYNINLAVVRCAVSPDVQKCKEEDVDNNVFTYQNGVELIVLELETMFDVNSIMSNALQLLLLKEVPIIEHLHNRKSLQSSLIGKRDLIYFYTKAIGTFEHRVFMEIAYAYQNQFTFAISTKLDTTKDLLGSKSLKSTAKFALWTLYCSKSSPVENESEFCPHEFYERSLSLSTLASYMQQFSEESNVLFAPENGTAFLLESEMDFPTVLIYTNTQMAEHTATVARALAKDVRGLAEINVINVDDKACRAIAASQGFDGHVPEVAVFVPGSDLTLLTKQERLDPVVIRDFLFDLITSSKKPAGDAATTANDLANFDKASEDEEFLLESEVEIQDDEMAKAVIANDGDMLGEMHHTPSVLKETFHDIVESADLKIVLYYLPFDAVSLTVLGHFEAAAKELSSSSSPATQDVLARVNCFDASDLCSRENVTTYPVVRIHRHDSPHQPYEGQMDSASMVKAAKLLKHGLPVQLKNEDDLNKFVTGDIPAEISDLSPTSVLLVAKREDKDAWRTLKSASKRLEAFVAMAEVTSDQLVDTLTKHYESCAPCVISIHHSDKIQPVRISSDIVDADKVVSFVKQSMIATMPELTVANFPALRAQNVPFVILFTNESDPASAPVKSAMTKVASMEDDFATDSVFCWMDGQIKSLGHQLLLEYTKTSNLPTIAVVDHKQAKVFTHGVTEALTSSEITEWLQNVFRNEEHPSKILEEKKLSPPGPHYDFLAMIDKELEEEQKMMAGAGGPPSNSSVMEGLDAEEELRRKLLEHHRAQVNSEVREGQSSDTAEETVVEDSVPIHAEL